MNRETRQWARDFMEEQGWLDWSSLKIGLDLGFISYQDVVDFAVDELRCTHKDVEELVVELASMSKSEHHAISTILETLAEHDVDQRAHNQWRLAIIKAIMESEASEKKVLDRVSQVYADFGYPEDMDEIIPYMPSEQAPLEALQALIVELSEHLDRQLSVDDERDDGCQS